MTKEWYSSSELVGMPGLPTTRPGLLYKARAEKWKSRPRQGRGGGREYHISNLPRATRDYLLRQAAAQVADRAETLPDPLEQRQAVAEMTESQRRVMNARLAVCNMIDELAATRQLKRGAAIEAFLTAARVGYLPESIIATLRAANARAGDDRLANRATVYRWFRERDRRGAAAVAPARGRAHRVPEWLPRLLSLYQSPQKWSVAHCLREWARRWPDEPAPNLRTAQRHLAMLPAEVREYGRMGRNARRAIQPFVRRTTDGLWPMDVVTVDGHLFKAYVRHPMTGRRFRPELTTYLDITTRRAVGFSAWLAESQYAIWIALRDMVLTPECGVPAIHYSDNGAYRGEQHRATLSRIGTTMMFSEPYRAQARGVIERFNSSVWVPLAREMPTYCGREMDPEAFKRALRRADQTGDNLMAWDDFVTACRQALADYNDRPHSHLGNRSPNQAWADALSDGWTPTTLDDDDLHDLLPSETRQVRRGEVSLPWGRYYADELALYHGRTVTVHFDPADGRRVWVADDRGVLICAAERDGNARPYVHASQMEHARAQREQGRLGRLERKAEAIREEARFQIASAPTPVSEQIVADTIALVEQQERQAQLADLNEDPRRRHAYFLQIRDRILAGDPVDDEQARAWAVYEATPQYTSMQQMFEEFGLNHEDFIDATRSANGAVAGG